MKVWEARGHFEEGRRWLDAALPLALAGPPSAIGARAVFAAAWLYNAGDKDEHQAVTERLYVQALECARAAGDLLIAAWALNSLGIMEERRGNFDASWARTKRALS